MSSRFLALPRTRNGEGEGGAEFLALPSAASHKERGGEREGVSSRSLAFPRTRDWKSTRLYSRHTSISYAGFGFKN